MQPTSTSSLRSWLPRRLESRTVCIDAKVHEISAYAERVRLDIVHDLLTCCLMSKKFTKRKKPATATATPEQKLLARQRFLAARALRKRRRRKSHQ